MKNLLKKIIAPAVIDAYWHKPRAVCAAFFFGFPARRLTCIAVAGTKGKTSTAYFLHDLLQRSGAHTALFSTAGAKLNDEEFLNTLKMTTPSPSALQHFLAQAVSVGCTHAVIEVSSHALKQHRVWGIPFAVVVITNLTSDHLEYHASTDDYVAVHKKLPSTQTRTIIVSEQDTNSAFFKKDPRTAYFTGTDKILEHCIESLPQWWAPFQCPNIRAASMAARALGVGDDALCSGLTALKAPPGRFEEIQEGQLFRVIVDYAHSPESLTYFFNSIRPLVSGKIIVVFGACGDRDANQRPLMGSILENSANTIILTSDDPYSEDPADIAHQVQKGIQATPESHIEIILDRKTAIERALALAQKNDCVCILGKGAEQLQIFKNKKIPWDDRATTRAILTHERM